MFCDNYCDNIAQYGNNVTLFIFVDIYKRVFSKLLESTNSLKNKKILLLVHPDIVFETTTSFAQL
jgi:preprotein translocase subunit SecY